MRFADRSDAGRRLAGALSGYAGTHPIIFALPRGGVPVAAEVARALGAPLELLIVRKIGVPQQPELAMGAVVDGPRPVVVRNAQVVAEAGITPDTFAEVRDRELAEIRRRRERYLGERPRPVIKDRVVLVIDDGIATGASMRAALTALRREKPRTLVLAVPVAAPGALAALEDVADDIVCPERREELVAIGLHYVDFSQVEDDEVVRILAAFPGAAAATAARP